MSEDDNTQTTTDAEPDESYQPPEPIKVECVCGKVWVSSSHKSFYCLTCGAPLLSKPVFKVVK